MSICATGVMLFGVVLGFRYNFPSSPLIDLYQGQTIWDLAEIDESNINIGLWALIIAKHRDPTIDVNRYLKKLDSLAQTVLKGLPDQSDLAKVSLIQIVLYRAGFWNQGDVFSYDFEDPFGDRGGSNLLPNALDRRRGNCLSLPALFLAVAERVDPQLQIRAVAVPTHFFCRFRDRQTNLILNIETTSGQMYEGDDIPIEKFKPTPRSVMAGLYMKDLTKKEFLVELLSTLVQPRFQHGGIESADQYADLALQINPRSPFGLITKSNVSYQKGKNLFDQIRRSGKIIDSNQKSELRRFQQKSSTQIGMLKRLGWRPSSEEDRRIYMESIRAFQSN